MPGEDRASPRRIEAAEKRKRALQLRKAGVSYDQIAQQVGYANRGNAHKAVMQELRELPKDDAKDVLNLEVERLDQLLMALWPAAMKGHVRSSETVIRLMERRSKLLGLDAPGSIQNDDDGQEQRRSALADLFALMRDAAS